MRELSRIRQARVLPTVVERIAGQTSRILNAAEVAEGGGLDQTTARDDIRLLEADDGRVLAFEAESAGRVSGNDLKGLAKLRDLLGDGFVVGVACYTGSRS